MYIQETRIYQIWLNIISKCHNDKNATFKLHGGKGIKVCDKWRNSFDAFFKDMGERPVGCVLERIDKNKDFTKENCFWLPSVKKIPYKKNYNSMRTKSHCDGVSKCKKTNVFISEIRHLKQNIEIGRFEKKNDAIRARLKAEIEFFGYLEQNQFSYLLK